MLSHVLNCSSLENFMYRYIMFFIPSSHSLFLYQIIFLDVSRMPRSLNVWKRRKCKCLGTGQNCRLMDIFPLTCAKSQLCWGANMQNICDDKNFLSAIIVQDVVFSSLYLQDGKKIINKISKVVHAPFFKLLQIYSRVYWFYTITSLCLCSFMP